jgi:exopolysaccharide biosynthesis polyprenyl glycosylphosphotransferase
MPLRIRIADWILPVAQVVLESFLSALTFLLAYRIWIGPLVPFDFSWEANFVGVEQPAPYLVLLPFIPLIRLAMNWRYGLHERTGTLSLMEDLSSVIRAALMGSLGLVCLAFLYRGGFEFRGHSYSRMVFFLDAVLYAGALFASRLLIHRWQRWLRSKGLDTIPCILVNAGKQAAFVRAQLEDSETWGHRIVAQMVVAPGDKTSEKLALLPDLIKRTQARTVIVSDPTITYHELVDVMLACDPGHKIAIRVVPDLRHYIPNKVALQRVGMLPTLSIFNEPIHGMQLQAKRAIDCAVATAALVALSPVMLLTALAIKIESPGPVFFRQARVGRDGRRFWLLKFRSMRANNDDSAHRALVSNMISGNGNGNGKAVHKLKDDPRITPLGRFIRRYSIDELPQLFNVLQGYMSLVGPRPPIAYEVEEYTHWHRKRLSIRPGVTGLWQTMGRSRRTYNQMVKLDNFYIDHWSLGLDLRILMRTLRVVLRGSDAY